MCCAEKLQSKYPEKLDGNAPAVAGSNGGGINLLIHAIKSQPMNELESALAKLKTSERTLNVFFRNDDVDADEPTLRQLIYTFWKLKTPLNLEVIPGRLTENCVALLKKYDRSQFELHQHGWRHINHEIAGRKCEFGFSRSYEQQFNDIARGKQRMDEAFGQSWSRVFTPPWNRCMEETHHVLDQLDFEGLSKDSSKPPITGYKFREISITLDLYSWKIEPAMKLPESIFSELARQVDELDRIGIMLHHKVMDAAAFTFLERLIEAFSNCPSVRFHTLQTLLHE